MIDKFGFMTHIPPHFTMRTKNCYWNWKKLAYFGRLHTLLCWQIVTMLKAVKCVWSPLYSVIRLFGQLCSFACFLLYTKIDFVYKLYKVIVHPKMKQLCWFTKWKNFEECAGHGFPSITRLGTGSLKALKGPKRIISIINWTSEFILYDNLG